MATSATQLNQDAGISLEGVAIPSGGTTPDSPAMKDLEKSTGDAIPTVHTQR